jgi:ankyrin repeat protein
MCCIAAAAAVLLLLLLLQALLRLDPELAVLPDMTANTPLHWACETGNAQLVAQLLPLKPELNMQNLNQNEYSAGGLLL